MANERIEIDEATKHFLSSQENMPQEIELRGQKYYLKQLAGPGYKGVVWKGLDEHNGDVAIKFAIPEDYLNRSYLQETTKYAKLRGYQYFAQFYNADVIELPDADKKRKFVCFVEEWIEGITLEKFVLEKGITSIFMLNYVKAMCEALNILKELKFRHDDLHSKNVMIANPKKGTFSKEHTVKIIDMGSLKPFPAPLTKEKDDHGRFTEHLILIWNSIQKRKLLPQWEKRFLNEAIPLLNHMLEEDVQIRLFDPSKIIEQFENAHKRGEHPAQEMEIKLENPFDYIAAEHIASDKLLVNLFAESCPWFKDVSGPNPILLTGPRGCGKSMLLRRLSLKALLFKSEDEIKKSLIVGFYISCSAELRNRLAWINTEAKANKFKREIIHYFNLLLCREIVTTLLYISRRDDRDTLFGLGAKQEKDLDEFLAKKLNINDELRLRLQGVKPLEHIYGLIEFDMDSCYQQIVRGLNVSTTTTESFLSELTKFLKLHISYFENKTIAFLIDDFSVHRIPEPVQCVLNPIIWDRQASHIFKLSAEKLGAKVILDLASNGETSATGDITRDYREIDCGLFYIDLSDRGEQKALVNFAIELLNHRLALSSYTGKAETIIGNSEYPEGSLSGALKQNGNDQYHGLQTISEICSGDISALLEIFRRIFKEGDIHEESQTVVPKHIQHKAIYDVSKDFLVMVKNYSPFGDEMYKIVEHFGNLSRKLLVEGKPLQSGLPRETTRIEVDLISELDLTPEHENLRKELVRRSIFIEMSPGRGRHTLGPTLRWQLRRIYCPAFKTGLRRRFPISWRASEFKYFLIDPKEKCDQEFKKWKKEENDKDQKGQEKLFPENGE